MCLDTAGEVLMQTRLHGTAVGRWWGGPLSNSEAWLVWTVHKGRVLVAKTTMSGGQRWLKWLATPQAHGAWGLGPVLRTGQGWFRVYGH